MTEPEISPEGQFIAIVVTIISLAYIYQEKVIEIINSVINLIISFLISILWIIILFVMIVIILYLFKQDVISGNYKNNPVRQYPLNQKPTFSNDLDSDDIEYERLKNKINQFKPLKRYKTEFSYQTELVGWLKRDYPYVKTEIQTESSRPDIIIDNIAIEIKGPTYKKDLDTIPSKILRYLNHYDYLIVVLFDLSTNEKYYTDWYNGIKKQFENVDILEIYSDEMIEVEF